MSGREDQKLKMTLPDIPYPSNPVKYEIMQRLRYLKYMYQLLSRAGS